MIRHAVAIAVLGAGLLISTGCAAGPHGKPPSQAMAAPSQGAPPTALLWARTAAEHRGAYLQAYRLATEHVQSAAKRKRRGSWAVILDIDETLLDNSELEFECWQMGTQVTKEAFAAWCRREEAHALPGAREFLHAVHALGGRAVLITNRGENVCEATQANLRKEELDFDEVLCSPGTDDKNPRFVAVQQGTPPSTLPPLAVVMWLGDNIQDFPDLTQAGMRDADDGAFGGFGTKFFLLPNPMYGSWAGNPFH